MPIISTNLLNSLRTIHQSSILNGQCTIYQEDNTVDAYNSPKKTWTVPRAGNTYPLACSLQEVQRVPKTSEDPGVKTQHLVEWNLKLPWNTIINEQDQASILDETGVTIKLQVISVDRRTSRISLNCGCKQLIS